MKRKRSFQLRRKPAESNLLPEAVSDEKPASEQIVEKEGSANENVQVNDSYITVAMEKEIGEEKKKLPAEEKSGESNLLPEALADEKPASEQIVEKEGSTNENVQVNDSNITEPVDVSKKEDSAPEVKNSKKKIG